MNLIITTIPLILGNVGAGEWFIILLVVLLLFGGKKIPELMRGVGRGIRSFKEGMNEIQDEINRPADKDSRHPADKDQ
jgi:sec-independent protein translocase protein TatA